MSTLTTATATATATAAAIDLHMIAPLERHALVFGRFDALQAGRSMAGFQRRPLELAEGAVVEQQAQRPGVMASRGC